MKECREQTERKNQTKRGKNGTHTLCNSENVLKYKHDSWIRYQQNNMLPCFRTNSTRRLYKTADTSLHGKQSDIPKDTQYYVYI